MLIGDPIRLSEDLTSENAVSPALAYNNEKQEYGAVWAFSSDSGIDIALQRFNAAGNLIGGNTLVPESGNFINDPDITYNGIDNQYLISFWNNAPDLNTGLFGQLLTAEGNPIKNNFLISNARFEPSFLYNPNVNEYYQTSRHSPGNGIFGQRIKSEGTLIGANTRIDSIGDSAPNGAVALNNVDNQYLAVWSNQADVADVVGRLIKPDGTFINEQFEIVEDSGLVFSISTAFDPINTQFLVAYGDPNEGDVLAQIIDADGTRIGDEITLLDSGFFIFGNRSISVAFSESLREYLLVAITTEGLVGQFVSSSGSPINDSFVISPRNDIFQTSVVYNDDATEFAVSWNFNLSDEGIFVQRIAPPAPPQVDKAVFSGTGNITTIVEGFRAFVGMGGDNNGNEIGSQGEGFREINWDGGAVPFNMPGNFFNNQNLPVNGLPRGVEFSTASALSLFGVSNPVFPADSFFGDNEFDTINPTYPEQFTTFSEPRLFAPLDLNFMDVDFFEPGVFDEDGDPVPALVTGFGAIFTDVDLPERTKLELFDRDGDLLFSQFVEPDPQGLSFLGVAFDQPVVSKVRITSGNVPLSLGLDDDPFGTGVDVVAMDNFIYGEPVVA